MDHILRVITDLIHITFTLCHIQRVKVVHVLVMIGYPAAPPSPHPSPLLATADAAEINVPSAENPQLSGILFSGLEQLTIHSCQGFSFLAWSSLQCTAVRDFVVSSLEQITIHSCQGFSFLAWRSLHSTAVSGSLF